MLLLAGVLFWAASSICQKMAFLRHYDADMPFGAAFAVCMMIFVAWDTKRVYTGSDAGSGPPLCRSYDGNYGRGSAEL